MSLSLTCANILQTCRKVLDNGRISETRPRIPESCSCHPLSYIYSPNRKAKNVPREFDGCFPVSQAKGQRPTKSKADQIETHVCERMPFLARMAAGKRDCIRMMSAHASMLILACTDSHEMPSSGQAVACVSCMPRCETYVCWRSQHMIAVAIGQHKHNIT